MLERADPSDLVNLTFLDLEILLEANDGVDTDNFLANMELVHADALFSMLRYSTATPCRSARDMPIFMPPLIPRSE
ncbi:hypothetical protein D9M70_636290 [compost metagenome]